MKRILVFIYVLCIAFAVDAQVCADCSIGLPVLAEPQQTGSPTVFSIPRTGTEVDCTGPTTDPVWSVTGAAQILGGGNSDTVIVSATGPYQLSLSTQSLMGGQSCTMLTASNVAANPDFEAACGLDIIMVLDESNSISASEEESVRNAVRSFANGLIGSGSRLAIVEFGTRAEAELLSDCAMSGQGSPHYIELEEEAVENCLEDYLVNDYGTTVSGGTNWDDALVKVQDVMNNNTVQPDIVIFFTDGNPTYYIDEHFNNVLAGSGSVTKAGSIHHAIVQANAVKSNAHLLVVGVGDQINLENIKLISGLDPFDGDISTGDYLLAGDFASLTEEFFDIALGICGTELHIANSGPSCAVLDSLQIEYQITFSNDGLRTARDVAITNVIPTGLDVVSQTRDPMTGTVERIGDRFTWDLGDLPEGAEGTWTFVLMGSPQSSMIEDMACIRANNHEAGSADTARARTMLSDLSVSAVLYEVPCNTSDGAIDLDISGGYPPYDIHWSNGAETEDLSGLSSGSYTLEMTDSAGCAAVSTFEITQAAPVSVYIPVSADSPPPCSPEPAVFQTEPGFTGYQWYLNGVLVAGADGPVHEAYVGGAYSVLATDSLHCVSGTSDTVSVEFAERPEIDIEQEGTLICSIGAQTELIASPGFASYSWSFNGILMESAAESALTVTSPGRYSVVGVDMAGCAAADTVEVMQQSGDVQTQVFETELAQVMEGTVCLGPDIIQTGGGSIGSAVSCRSARGWDYTIDVSGDRVCLDIAAVAGETEADTICLVTCSSLPCQPCDTTYLLLPARKEDEPPVHPSNCIIPDVITPNGDGLNDAFRLACYDGDPVIELEVYNRWGSQVFHGPAYNNDWKGTYRGKALPSGTYFYIIRLNNADGSLIRLAGDLTILR